jgi:hypothetical protein
MAGQLSNIIYAGLLRIFGPGISSYAQEFGLGESVTMKGMKAVLYPIWRIDAIFEGGVESEKTRKEKEAYLAVEEGYVPGKSVHRGDCPMLKSRQPFRSLIISVFRCSAPRRPFGAISTRDRLEAAGRGFRSRTCSVYSVANRPT